MYFSAQLYLCREVHSLRSESTDRALQIELARPVHTDGGICMYSALITNSYTLFFYKHTVNFQSSSICLAFIQFEPKNMLNPMLNKEILKLS